MSGNSNDNNKPPKAPITPPSALFGTVASLERQMEQMRSITQPLGGIQRMLEKMPHLRVNTGAITHLDDIYTKLDTLPQNVSWMGSIESFVKEMEGWRSLQVDVQMIAERHRSVAEMCTLPTNVLASNLEQIRGIADGLSLNVEYPKLSERLLAPTTYFSRFYRETLAELQKPIGEHRSRALSGALLLAEDQLSATTKLVTKVLDQPIGPDLATAAPKYTLFERTQDDLIEADELPDAEAAADLYPISAANQVGLQARDVIKSVERCNQNAQMHGQGAVFRPTTALVGATVDLGVLGPATDKKEFGEVVDALYILLYEGAGAGPGTAPRYMRHGYVTDDECEVVWRVKHFRNLWLRHDPGHGSSSSQRRKRRKLRAALKAYGFDRAPASRDEFEELHRALIRDVAEFLDHVERQIP